MRPKPSHTNSQPRELPTKRERGCKESSPIGYAGQAAVVAPATFTVRCGSASTRQPHSPINRSWSRHCPSAPWCGWVVCSAQSTSTCQSPQRRRRSDEHHRLRQGRPGRWSHRRPRVLGRSPHHQQLTGTRTGSPRPLADQDLARPGGSAAQVANWWTAALCRRLAQNLGCTPGATAPALSRAFQGAFGSPERRSIEVHWSDEAGAGGGRGSSSADGRRRSQSRRGWRRLGAGWSHGVDTGCKREGPDFP
jgi:hypothetical protein